MARTVNIELFPTQQKLLTTVSKTILLICSRGYGKSVGVAFWCIYKLLTGAERGMLVCPTFSQLKETTKYLIGHLDHLGLDYAVNKNPDWCKSQYSDHKNLISINDRSGKHKFIKLISAHNPETIRGSSVDFIAFDEAALLDEETVDISLPCLRGNSQGAKYPYSILLATTPRDTSNWIYKRYIEKETPSFTELKANAAENYLQFDKEKLETIKGNMTDLMWRREMECEWITLNNRTMARSFNARHIKREERFGALFMTCDINCVDLQTGVGYFDPKRFHISNEILIPEHGTPQKVAQEFNNIFRYEKNKIVFVFGDSSGSNRSTTSIMTYYDTLFHELKRLGWTVKDNTNSSNPKGDNYFDSNEVFNHLMEKDAFSIDPGCKETIRHLKEARYEEDSWRMDKKFLDSGFYDGIRYFVWETYNNNGSGMSFGTF